MKKIDKFVELSGLGRQWSMAKSKVGDQGKNAVQTKIDKIFRSDVWWRKWGIKVKRIEKDFEFSGPMCSRE